MKITAHVDMTIYGWRTIRQRPDPQRGIPPHRSDQGYYVLRAGETTEDFSLIVGISSLDPKLISTVENLSVVSSPEDGKELISVETPQEGKTFEIPGIISISKA